MPSVDRTPAASALPGPPLERSRPPWCVAGAVSPDPAPSAHIAMALGTQVWPRLDDGHIVSPSKRTRSPKCPKAWRRTASPRQGRGVCPGTQCHTLRWLLRKDRVTMPRDDGQPLCRPGWSGRGGRHSQGLWARWTEVTQCPRPPSSPRGGALEGGHCAARTPSRLRRPGSDSPNVARGQRHRRGGQATVPYAKPS